jgi:hypothetical protein
VRCVQLVVWYFGQSKPNYFQVTRLQGWRIDTLHRQLVIGKGMGRVMVPFDNVSHYSVEEYDAE